MTSEPDIREHLEAVVGYELSPEAAERLLLVQAVASATVDDNATTTLRNLIFVQPNRCYLTRVLDIGGVAMTRDDGTTQFRLTQFMCADRRRFGPPINVVATPLSPTPCYLTVLHRLLDDGADVEVQAWSWDAAGNPAPSVSFDWRCRVELPIIIL
jgi:hypothetical protein